MLNKVILIGNIGAKPEFKTLENKKKIAFFSLATSEYWKDKQTGEKQSKIEWHRISIYNENIVNFVEKYLDKGSKVYIEGSISSKKYNDKEGIEKVSYEIICKEIKSLQSKEVQKNEVDQENEKYKKEIEENESDEIPF